MSLRAAVALIKEREERAKDRAAFGANVKGLEGDKAELAEQVKRLTAERDELLNYKLFRAGQ